MYAKYEIVKLDRNSIPSRTKWGVDKLAVGEAIRIPYEELPVHGASSIRGSITAAKKTWANGKKFRLRAVPNERVLLVYRES